MAKTSRGDYRVDFSKAPPSVLKALYGDTKDKQAIFAAISDLYNTPTPSGKTGVAPHVEEIFHYINTDGDGEWILNDNGEPAIGKQSLERQLGVLVNTGEIARTGDRTGRYVLTDAAEIEETEEDAEDA